MNYHIYLEDLEIQGLSKENVFEFFLESNSAELFSRARYTYLNYYLGKTPKITLMHSGTPNTTPPALADDEACIVYVEGGRLRTFFLNKFKSQGNKIFYIHKHLAKTDIERTWWLIQQKIKLAKVKRMFFVFPDFSKIVFAYRLSTAHGIEIKDMTYS